MWLDSKAVNCPQKWGNFKVILSLLLAVSALLTILNLLGWLSAAKARMGIE